MTRNVVITGGGTGIGRAMAARFAAAGDTVFITGRRTDVLEAAAAELGTAVTAITCDHTDPQQLAELARQLPAAIDVLINNAGGNTDIGAAEPTDLAGIAAAWHTNLDANVLTAVLTTELLAERLTDGGTVIHLGSIAAEKGAGAYGAAKAAIASWNVGISRRLGERGITSNIVAPGHTIDTEFFADQMTPQWLERNVSATVFKRPGVPTDIAGAAWFLASADARYLTGQVITVDGGAFPRR